MIELKNSGLISKIVIIIIAVALVGLMAYSISHPTPNAHIGDGNPWNKNMTLGKTNAPNKLILYTDYFCSYCANVHSAISSKQFTNTYIKTGKVRLESRTTTMLSYVSANTDQGAEAAYCSADQNKYWQYSDDIISRIKSDYFDKGIGVKDVANPQKIPKLAVDYFVASAVNTGLNTATFRNCMTSEKHKQQIADNTEKATNLGVDGLPYIVINNYQTSGFVGNYDTLVTALKAGGVN